MTIRHIVGWTIAGATAFALVLLSHIDIPVHTGDEALLRVAWSARPERIETCRTLSDDELAGIPVHMRQRVVCEGATASYRLDVRRGDSTLASAVLRGGGLRRDRQIYVFREIALPSGRSELEVRLTRVEQQVAEGTAPAAAGEQPREPDVGASSGAPSQDQARATREIDERRRRLEEAVPPALVLRESVMLTPGEVVLVTYDRITRQLRLERGEP
jgi:hypothetical protein